MRAVALQARDLTTGVVDISELLEQERLEVVRSPPGADTGLRFGAVAEGGNERYGPHLPSLLEILFFERSDGIQRDNWIAG